MSSTPDSAVRTYIKAHKAVFPDDLAAWLRIPSVPAEPSRAPDLRSGAAWLAAEPEETGFPAGEICDTRPPASPGGPPGAPAVFAQWPSAAFGPEIRFTRDGGSGPAAGLRDEPDVPALFPGISVPSHGWLSVDEKVGSDLLMKGVETSAHLWSDLAEARTTGSWKQP